MARTITKHLCEGCVFCALMPYEGGFMLWHCLLKAEQLVCPGKGCDDKIHKGGVIK